MSVYTTLFVTPMSATQPTHTQLGKLVDGLVSNNFVVPPWGVVEGTFNPKWPEYIGSYMRIYRNGHAVSRVF